MGKTSMGYKTLFEQIKTVCAWNSLISQILNRYFYSRLQMLGSLVGGGRRQMLKGEEEG